MTTFDCAACGKESQSHKKTTRYCSVACRSKGLEVRHTFKCEECGKERVVPASYIKGEAKRYCSRTCKAKAQRRPHPFNCAVCGKPGLRGTRCVGQSPQKYCSMACRAKDRMLPAGQTSRNLVLGRYKYSAQARKFDWGLTDNQAFELFLSNCHYCGRIPSTVSASRGADGLFLYNGIDRVDNSFGYVPSNVVACCTRCNVAKATASAADFEAWILRAAAHLCKSKKRSRSEDRPTQMNLYQPAPLLSERTPATESVN